MENKKYVEETAKYQEKIKELFKEFSENEAYETWADTFEIDLSEEKQVTVTYEGDLSIKRFKKECKDTLSAAISSVLGDGKKIVISPKSKYSSLSPKAKKNIKAAKFFAVGMVFVCLAAAIIIVLCNYISNRNFKETFYSTSSIKVDSRVRVIHISDLHSTSYGKNNEKLLTRVSELKPDIIICTGDILDVQRFDLNYLTTLGEKLAEIAPSYYIYGNNEIEKVYNFSFLEKSLDKRFGFNKDNRDENVLPELSDSLEEKIEKTGMKVLKNEKDTIKVKTMEVDIYGVLNSNPSSFWSYSGNRFSDYIYENPDNLKITAIHEPFIFEEFEQDFWGDLMVCGHTHGGVIRIPILGPLYTHEGGILPERGGSYVYGRYDVAGRPLIVSGGLENSNLLRINNEPELVIIDINKF